ncbi:hypothetical protein [Reyranella sp.]|uniref:hypothetical protein n=1 Tax=Reyranella sp. TaxID=1929291 RepID=UPI00378401B3
MASVEAASVEGVGMIERYVANLRRQLDFDPALAERLASEVEDHLREAVEADPAGPSIEAEHRAVERFGLAREIAGQFAAEAVDRQARRTWLTLLVAVVVTFVAMRLRIMGLDDSAGPALAPLIDRYGFLAALAVSAVGWLAFRRSLLAPTLCLVGLAASITAGVVRAGLFDQGAPLLVLLAAAGEFALLGLLLVEVVGFGRRLRRTASLRGATP